MAGLRAATRAWRAYESALSQRPVTTQVCTTTALWSLGDYLSQQMEAGPEYDLQRTVYAGLFGAAFIGPTGHMWYQFLDRAMARRVARGTTAFVLAKVATDELIWGPMHVASFFAYMTAAQGGSWQDVKDKLRRDFVSAYLAELAVWPAFQAFNFAKVPVRHQLLMVNLACLGDATFLCWVRQQENWLETVGLARH